MDKFYNLRCRRDVSRERPSGDVRLASRETVEPFGTRRFATAENSNIGMNLSFNSPHKPLSPTFSTKELLTRVFVSNPHDLDITPRPLNPHSSLFHPNYPDSNME